jgi:hypothetical protein
MLFEKKLGAPFGVPPSGGFVGIRVHGNAA